MKRSIESILKIQSQLNLHEKDIQQAGNILVDKIKFL